MSYWHRLDLLFLRFIGGDKIPEFWGKPSAYTEGTAFLGTPKNHLDVSAASGLVLLYMQSPHSSM